MDSIRDLLVFVREGRALRVIELAATSDYVDAENMSEIMGVFLPAIAANENVQNVTIGFNLAVPQDAFIQFMQTTKSMKSLSIDLQVFRTVESIELVTGAIGAHHSLEKLSMDIEFEIDLFEQILSELNSHPSLRTLSLTFMGEAVTELAVSALSSFLSLNSIPLESLELTNVAFVGHYMESLLAGLKLCTKLGKLSMHRCRFDSESTSKFVGFFQVCPKRLCNLVVSGKQEMFDELNTGMVVGSILTPCEHHEMGDVQSGTTSSITALDLDIGDCAEFIKIAANSKLQSLRLHDVDTTTSESLIRWLPNWLNLHELTLVSMDGIVNKRELLTAMQKNGSLYTVHCGQEDSTFGPAELRFIDAFARRNKMLPLLLQTTSSINKESMCSVSGMDQYVVTDIVLFPSLFHVSKQANRMALSNILLGLLKISDTMDICN